jgi:hypothetical protein
VRQHRFDLAVIFVIASAVCGYLAVTVPAHRGIVLRGYVLVVGGLAMVALLSGVGAALPRRRRSELAQALGARPAAPKRVTELERIEREVTLAVGSAYDLHRRLLPQLRDIAEARLERSGKRFGP